MTGCSSLLKPEKEIVTVTKIEALTIPLTAKPKPVQLNEVKIYVVNRDTYEEYLKEYEAKNGQVAWIAISVKDYENLSLNFAELRRYIEQQKQIILYYETAISESSEAAAAQNNPQNNEE